MTYEAYPWLKVDNIVELRADEHGFKDSWFLVKIKELKYTKNKQCNEVHVEYPDFFESDEPGSRHLEEVVKPSILRPLCPYREEDVLRETYKRRLRKVGDLVEVQHEDAWWEGYIKEVIDKGTEYVVSFNHGYEDLKLPSDKIRTRWDYRRIQGTRQWKWVKACDPR